MPALDCLETIRNPGELNRLLTSIRTLGGNNGRARVDRLERILQDETFEAGPVQIDDLLDLALHFRLIHLREEDVSITPTGETFLAENLENQYAITEGQKHLLVESILFSRSQLSTQFEGILPEFFFNAASERYETSNVAESGRLRALGIRLFCSSLGFLLDDDNGIRFLDPVFNTKITRRIRIYRQAGWDGTVPTDEDLERAAHAEELVLEDEANRLGKAGFPELVRRVQHVSGYNASAGFDIQSFEGPGSRPDVPDRFIEVKASRGRALHFVFTRNELRKAEELRNQYRIVFLGKHDIGRTLGECEVTIIIDPAEQIFDRSKYAIEAARLRVTARNANGVEVTGEPAQVAKRVERKRRSAQETRPQGGRGKSRHPPPKD